MQLSSAITLQISRVKPGNPRSEGGTDGREGEGGREGRMGGREGWMDGCDGNYEVCAYGMESVHNREPERSRVTSY